MDQPGPVISVQHVYACSPERVFDAWIDPAVADRWLFATPDGRIVRCDIEPRAGGAFVIADRRAGEDVEHVGTYVEVERPRRLAFTFSVPKFSSELTAVSVDVAPVAAGCELTLVHRDVPPEWSRQTEQGWRDLLDRLAAVLGA